MSKIEEGGRARGSGNEGGGREEREDTGIETNKIRRGV